MPTLALQTAAIKVQLNNHPTADTTLIERIYNEEYKALAKSFFFDVLDFSESVNTVASTATIAPSTNSTWFLIESILNTTTPAVLEERDTGWYNLLDDPTETGVPEFFIMRLNTIYLYPVPDGVYAMTIKGRKAPATLASGDPPGFPEEWHYVIEQQTVYRLALELGMHDTMMAAKNAALNRLSELTEQRTMRRRQIFGQATVERGRGSTY